MFVGPQPEPAPRAERSIDRFWSRRYQGSRRALVAGCAAAAALLLAASTTASAAPEEQSKPAADELRVLSLNLWHGGAQVDDGLAKQVALINKHQPDIVGFQETSGHAAKDIAEELGWHHYQSDGSIGVISRFPLTEVGGTSAAAGVRVEYREGRELELWSAHLGYDPYGPYDACFDGMDVEDIFEREAESGRVPQARELAKELAPKIADADEVPVLLVGDYNSPSHLDWTAETVEEHCGYGPVEWPTTKILEEAGLTDSYRVAHPDPAADPGTTWSPLYPYHDGDSGDPEPQDRIDYVTHAGDDLTVADSVTIVDGDPTPVPNHADNEWPTDHAGVLTTFTVN